MATPTKMAQVRAARQSGGIPAEALSSGDPAAPAAQTKMAQVRATIDTGEYVVLPIYGRVWIELVGHDPSNIIEAATYGHMAEIGLPPVAALHAWSYDIQRSARTLALAVRDPEDHAASFGSLEEWLVERDDVIFWCFTKYKDVKSRLDPDDSEITPELRAMIDEDFSKKNASRLRSYGVATLVTWLLTGDLHLGELATSPGPASRSGESSPVTSET